MKEKALRMYQRMEQIHNNACQAIVKLIEGMQSTSLPDMVDATFLLRECAVFCEDLRKEFNRMQELIERTACYMHTQDSIKDPSTPERVRGEFATGTPNVTETASLPKAGSEEDLALRAALGLQDSPLTRIHWPTMNEHLSMLSSEGKPLPPGIDPSKTHTQYKFAPLRRLPGVSLSDRRQNDG